MARKFLAAAVIVIGALALTAGYRYLRPADLKPIGGEWYIKSESGQGFGHSSYWDDLYRKSGLWFVRPAGYSQRAGAWQPVSSEVTPIALIRELANQQPAYRRDWREHASFEMKMY